MALQTKKLSQYENLTSSDIDTTTKLVALTGSINTNRNIPVSNFVEDSLESTSSLKPLSAKQGKVLNDTKAPKAYPEFIGGFALVYSTPDGDENSNNIFSIVNTATGQIVFQINDYGNMQQFKNAYFEGDEFEARNPTFNGSVRIPSGSAPNHAVNKGQLDLKQNSYTLQPVNTAGLINQIPTEKHFGIYVFTASTEFDINIANCAIGSTIVLKNIGDIVVSVVSGGTMTLDGQNIDVTTDGVAYLISGAYGSKKLYKNGASSWITIAETTTQEWISTSTITKYTKLGNTFIEL